MTLKISNLATGYILLTNLIFMYKRVNQDLPTITHRIFHFSFPINKIMFTETIPKQEIV